jgi:hypothetical protein
MKKIILKVWMILAISFLAMDVVGQTAPVISYTPTIGATNVSVSPTLSIEFDANVSLNVGSIYIYNSDFSSFFEVSTGKSFPPAGPDARITINANILSIDLSSSLLLYETQYWIYTTENAILVDGIPWNTLSTFDPPGEWTFLTEAEPFELTLKAPIDGAVDVPITQSLVATFNQNIQFAAGGASVSIYSYGDDVLFETLTAGAGLSTVGMELTINPTINFAEGTRYYVIIPSDVIETTTGTPFSGVALKDDWDFTTAYLPLDPPTLNPLNGAAGVLRNAILEVTFDKDIEMSGAGSIGIWANGAREKLLDAISPNVSIFNNNTLRIDLSGSPLAEYATLYDVRISSDFIKRVGSETYFAGFAAGEWSFTTEAEPITADPPAILPATRLPAPGSTEVSRAPTIEVQFDKQIQWGVEGLFRLRRMSDDGIVETMSPNETGTTISTDLLSIVFSSPTLDYGIEYYVEITNDFVRAVDGSVPFSGVAKIDSWSFTTETAPPFWADTYPSIQNQNTNSFDLVGQLDQTGTYYYVVASSGDALDHATIFTAATSGGDGGFLIAGNDAMTMNVEFSKNLSTTPLEYGQVYYLFVYAASGGKNSEIIRLEIERIAPRLLSLGTYPSAGYSVTLIDAEILLNFSEKIFAVDNGSQIEITELNVADYIQLFEVDGLNPISASYTIDIDEKLYTITPLAGLSENTSYKVVIGTVTDDLGNQASIPDHTFSTDKQQVWLGVNSSWTDDNNWSTGAYVTGKSVTISALSTVFPEITTGTVEVHNLTIEPGAAVTHTGGTLNVTGLLHLQSSPEVNATYLNNGGTLGVEPEQIRIDQVVSYADRTYHISSPVNGANRLSIGATQEVYSFDNLSGTWANAFNNALDFGVGYITRSANDLLFSGALNMTSFPHTVYRSDAGYGWNLIGNPYTATLDFSNMITPDIESAFWLWKNDEGIYGTMNFDSDLFVNLDSDLIPSNHSFFIKVKTGIVQTDLTYSPTYLVNNTNSYLKSSTSASIDHIKLAAVSGNVEDQVAIGFIDNASVGVDRFDSEKYLGRSSNVLELFSLSGNNRLAINCQPNASSTTIPLGYSTVTPGTYKIKLSTNTLEGSRLFLNDSELDVTEELNLDDYYEFSVESSGTNHTRFSLLVERIISDVKGAGNLEPELNIFSNNSSIFLVVDDFTIGSPYLLTDMTGRTISRGFLDSSGVQNLGKVSKGGYVLQIIISDQYLIKKQKVVVH